MLLELLAFKNGLFISRNKSFIIQIRWRLFACRVLPFWSVYHGYWRAPVNGVGGQISSSSYSERANSCVDFLAKLRVERLEEFYYLELSSGFPIFFLLILWVPATVKEASSCFSFPMYQKQKAQSRGFYGQQHNLLKYVFLF